MNRLRPRGTTLVVGLMLLAVVTLLGLAGASGAHVERQLARNEQFRENAASAASAGIEHAISRIVSSPLPEIDDTPVSVSATLSGSSDRYETVTRFAGYESALPQEAGAALAGAHFEITSTGYSGGGAIDRQRAAVMLVVPAPVPAVAPGCAPDAGIPCLRAGEFVRLAWHRVPPP
jgi:hypothetical protein